jgi:hypothetical protein
MASAVVGCALEEEVSAWWGGEDVRALVSSNRKPVVTIHRTLK